MNAKSEGLFTFVICSISNEDDIVLSRRWAKRIAQSLGFSHIEQTRISTAVSEISRNAFIHGSGGEAAFQLDLDSDPKALQITIEDSGPTSAGAADKASRAYRSQAGLGIGVSGSRRLVSDFRVQKLAEGGTRVAMRIDLTPSMGPIGLSEAGDIRESIIMSGDLDAVSELKRQNKELIRSLELIRDQKNELFEANVKLAQSESQYRALNVKLTTLMDNFPEAILFFNQNCELEYANVPARTLTENWRGQDDLVPLGLRDKLEFATRHGQDYVPVGQKGVIRLKVGKEERSFLPRIRTMLDEDERSRGVLLTVQDVTEFQLLEDLKIDMLGTVSHEIKSPVTSIRMALHLLLEEEIGKLNESQRELAVAASDEVGRLLSTLHNLLDVSRYEEGVYNLDKQRVSPEELLTQSLAEMKHIASQMNIRIRDVTTDKNLPELMVDRGRLVYALNNFISNAIKHTSEKGQVRVAISREPDDWVRFRVMDDGPGVPKKYQQFIFNRFAKVPGNRKPGTGLGLTVARDFVQAHEGRIGVISEPPDGSEFFFEVKAFKKAPEGD